MHTLNGPGPTIVVASSHGRVVRARSTVRSALANGGSAILVVDLDDSYRPVGPETVVPLTGLVGSVSSAEEVARAVATLEPSELSLYAGAAGAQQQLADGCAAVLVLAPGVHLLRDPWPHLGTTAGSTVVPALDVAAARTLADAAGPVTRMEGRPGRATTSGGGVRGSLSPALVVLRSERDAVLLRSLAAEWRLASDALVVFADGADPEALRDRTLLLTPWRAAAMTEVAALDLTALDPERPWLLAADPPVPPRVLLSEHPELAATVASVAADRLADADAYAEPTHRLPDAALRAEARRSDASGTGLPDVLGLVPGPPLADWAVELVRSGDRWPVARHLAAVRQARPDLRARFRKVPGGDAKALARWAAGDGVVDGEYDAELLARAATATLTATPPAPEEIGPLAEGVNLVGFLTGELGIGTSARLVDEALQAAGVPTSTDDVSSLITSRRSASYRRSDATRRRTTLLCVNSANTAGVARQRAALLEATRVIGMWYWELAEFPESQHGGFAHVDEVWVATDFMRDAIAPHAGDVPVRTLTPPLPQAGSDPGTLPARFGIPTERPWFLFTFDFHSVAERKNPWGLVEAFSRAFGDRPEAERPTLVIKTINGDHEPGDAERLRLLVAGRSDVLFLDTYLDDAERHVLVAHCTAYVSLHRAEGLGLTVAEAMAWGRPVITTGYGGVTQFCDDDNAFLVDWAPTVIERTVGPYERGLTWAEPDLDHAARLLRLVVSEPDRARAVGERAARDIRERHDAAAAGARMRDALAEGDRDRRAAEPSAGQDPASTGVGDRVRSALTARRRRRE